MTSDANAGAIQTWNGVLYDKWVRFQYVLTTGLAIHGDEALRRYPPREGASVLDVGCGFGDTTREIARRVGPRGVATGFDAAERFIEAARHEAERAALPNARFFAADAESGNLGGPYDVAFSRFGTMFCASPVAVFRNVKKSLVPNGELTMIVWRRRDENPWLHEAELRVKELVPDNRPPEGSTCGPGPFSMSGPDMVSDQLKAGGFTEITFGRFDADICIGKDLDEAVEFAMALGPAGELIRLAADEGERLRPKVSNALRETLSRYSRDDGVYAPSSTWIVHAKA
ncbi:MAG TPA: class I SAM-dependent methyltransferase [Polyangiaceae bacterium]